MERSKEWPKFPTISNVGNLLHTFKKNTDHIRKEVFPKDVSYWFKHIVEILTLVRSEVLYTFYEKNTFVLFEWRRKIIRIDFRFTYFPYILLDFNKFLLKQGISKFWRCIVLGAGRKYYDLSLLNIWSVML